MPTRIWKLSRRQAVVGSIALHALVVAAVVAGRLAVPWAIVMVAIGWCEYGYQVLRRRDAPAIATALTAEGITVAAGPSVTVVPWDQVDALGDVEVELGFVRLVLVRTKTKFAFGRLFILRREGTYR